MPVLDIDNRERASLVDALARVRPVPLRVVELSVSPEVAVDRFRGSPTHQATDLNEQLVSERARTFPYSDQALQLSRTDSPEELAERVTHRLSERPLSVDANRWAETGNP
ncbi:MAG: hypothetical protein JWP74_4210 [Marmoricola sp.]|nr:hypothetical protein [Marmoricola sp.]